MVVVVAGDSECGGGVHPVDNTKAHLYGYPFSSFLSLSLISYVPFHPYLHFFSPYSFSHPYFYILPLLSALVSLLSY